MNTLAPLFIVLAMLIATVVLLANAARVLEGNPALMNLRLIQSLSTAQNAGNTLVLGLPGFVPLKNGKAGSSEHKAEDGAS
jgi:hypothetical protein